jgi:hypothetical protein
MMTDSQWLSNLHYKDSVKWWAKCINWRDKMRKVLITEPEERAIAFLGYARVCLLKSYEHLDWAKEFDIDGRNEDIIASLEKTLDELLHDCYLTRDLMEDKQKLWLTKISHRIERGNII